ncbi:MAG: hypothetical protein ACYDHW_10470 [Syntrophorhabdaceae bacterium]
MTVSKNLIGCITPQDQKEPRCKDIRTIDGIIVEGQVFLPSLMPCCGLLALPFWAKVSGWLVNERQEESIVSVVVTLFDDKERILADYSDVVAIEAGQKISFDVKLLDYQEIAEMYSIAVGDMELS